MISPRNVFFKIVLNVVGSGEFARATVPERVTFSIALRLLLKTVTVAAQGQQFEFSLAMDTVFAALNGATSSIAGGAHETETEAKPDSKPKHSVLLRMSVAHEFACLFLQALHDSLRDARQSRYKDSRKVGAEEGGDGDSSTNDGGSTASFLMRVQQYLRSRGLAPAHFVKDLLACKRHGTRLVGLHICLLLSHAGAADDGHPFRCNRDVLWEALQANQTTLAEMLCLLYYTPETVSYTPQFVSPPAEDDCDGNDLLTNLVILDYSKLIDHGTEVKYAKIVFCMEVVLGQLNNVLHCEAGSDSDASISERLRRIEQALSLALLTLHAFLVAKPKAQKRKKDLSSAQHLLELVTRMLGMARVAFLVLCRLWDDAGEDFSRCFGGGGSSESQDLELSFERMRLVSAEGALVETDTESEIAGSPFSTACRMKDVASQIGAVAMLEDGGRIEDALVTSFVTYFGRALCPVGLDPVNGVHKDSAELDPTGGVFYSQAVFGMVLGKGVEALAHLVQHANKAKMGGDEDLSLSQLWQLYGPLPVDHQPAEGTSASACVCMFLNGRFLHRNAVYVLTKQMVASQQDGLLPHETVVLETLVLLETLRVVWRLEDIGTAGDVMGSGTERAARVDAVEFGRWVPHLVQLLRTAIPKIAALLFDIVVDKRDDNAATAASDPPPSPALVSAVFGKHSDSDSHPAAQLMTLLRVLCFMMVTCVEHLHAQQAEAGAASKADFSTNEEILAYVACCIADLIHVAEPYRHLKSEEMASTVVKYHRVFFSDLLPWLTYELTKSHMLERQLFSHLISELVQLLMVDGDSFFVQDILSLCDPFSASFRLGGRQHDGAGAPVPSSTSSNSITEGSSAVPSDDTNRVFAEVSSVVIAALDEVAGKVKVEIQKHLNQFKAMHILSQGGDVTWQFAKARAGAIATGNRNGNSGWTCPKAPGSAGNASLEYAAFRASLVLPESAHTSPPQFVDHNARHLYIVSSYRHECESVATLRQIARCSMLKTVASWAMEESRTSLKPPYEGALGQNGLGGTDSCQDGMHTYWAVSTNRSSTGTGIRYALRQRCCRLAIPSAELLGSARRQERLPFTPYDAGDDEFAFKDHYLAQYTTEDMLQQSLLHFDCGEYDARLYRACAAFGIPPVSISPASFFEAECTLSVMQAAADARSSSPEKAAVLERQAPAEPENDELLKVSLSASVQLQKSEPKQAHQDKEWIFVDFDEKVEDDEKDDEPLPQTAPSTDPKPKGPLDFLKISSGEEQASVVGEVTFHHRCCLVHTSYRVFGELLVVSRDDPSNHGGAGSTGDTGGGWLYFVPFVHEPLYTADYQQIEQPGDVSTFETTGLYCTQPSAIKRMKKIQSWPLQSLVRMEWRRALLKRCAVELFFEDGASALFSFILPWYVNDSLRQKGQSRHDSSNSSTTATAATRTATATVPLSPVGTYGSNHDAAAAHNFNLHPGGSEPAPSERKWDVVAQDKIRLLHTVVVSMLKDQCPKSLKTGSMKGPLREPFNPTQPVSAVAMREVGRWTSLWQQRKLSNFDYIMKLNSLAGRTFQDLGQYPVFPWVLKDFTSETLDLSDPSVFRDLSQPVGALNADRLESLQDRFQSMGAGLSATTARRSDDAQKGGEGNDDSTIEILTQSGWLYGSHYSNEGNVLGWLIRLEPFSTYLVKLQGGQVDTADRLFHSMEESWDRCMVSEASFKELIPEFFVMPEFLENVNQVDLGVRQNGDRVNNVVLPPWAHGSPERFIAMHRLALESEAVSQSLHLWVDLIFGSKQRGAAAVAANNVFHPLTYEGGVDWSTILDPHLRESVVSQIVNFGTTPAQIFDRRHPARFSESYCIERRALKCAVNDFGKNILYTPLSLLSSAAMGSAHLKKTVIQAPQKFGAAALNVIGAAADAGRTTLTGLSRSPSDSTPVHSFVEGVLHLPRGQGAVKLWFEEEHWQGSRMWVLQQDGSTCGITYRPYSQSAQRLGSHDAGASPSSPSSSSSFKSPEKAKEDADNQLLVEDVLLLDEQSLGGEGCAVPDIFTANLRNRMVLLPSSLTGGTEDWNDDSIVLVNEWDGAIRTRTFDRGEIRQQIVPGKSNGTEATAIAKVVDGSRRTLLAVGFANGQIKLFETTLNSPKQGNFRRVIEGVGSALRISGKPASAPLLCSPRVPTSACLGLHFHHQRDLEVPNPHNHQVPVANTSSDGQGWTNGQRPILPVKMFSDHHSAITCVAMACVDGSDLVVSGSSCGEVILQSLSTGAIHFRQRICDGTVNPTSSSILSVDFTALQEGVVVQVKARLLLLSTANGRTISELALQQPMHTAVPAYNLPTKHPWPKSPVRADLVHFFLTADNTEVCLRNIFELSKAYTLFSGRGITSAMVTPDGRNVVISLASGALHLMTLPAFDDIAKYMGSGVGLGPEPILVE
jgi:hypothetical protein